MFNEEDDRLARNVCVIGTGVRDALFGSPEEIGREINPVGDFVNIGSQRFRIIGMFEHYQSALDLKAQKADKEGAEKPASSGPKRRAGGGTPQGRGGYFEWKNKTIFIPFNTMWLRFRAGANLDGTSDPRLSSLEFMVIDMDQMNNALQQVKNVLMHTHKGIEDFSFNTNENWSDNIASAVRNARLTGGIIAAISLLVGGVGIMNIMLASITERVREIGVRKAVGATFAHVFIQILIESVVIAIIGGVAGLLASKGLVNILALLSPGDDAPVITLNAMLLGFGFSVFVGIMAGLIPAFKAARLHPIQALRYE
jgi:putative ABC transport system permease protein